MDAGSRIPGRTRCAPVDSDADRAESVVYESDGSEFERAYSMRAADHEDDLRLQAARMEFDTQGRHG